MKSDLSRRRILQTMGAAALSRSSMRAAAVPGMRSEGRDTPKICMSVGTRELDETSMRRWKQIAVDHVLMGGPQTLPWQESEISSIMDRLKAGGLSLGNMMIAGFPKTIYRKNGREEEIEKAGRW